MAEQSHPSPDPDLHSVAAALVFNPSSFVFCPKGNTTKFSTGNAAGPAPGRTATLPPSQLVPASYVCSAECSCWRHRAQHRERRGWCGDGTWEPEVRARPDAGSHQRAKPQSLCRAGSGLLFQKGKGENVQSVEPTPHGAAAGKGLSLETALPVWA